MGGRDTLQQLVILGDGACSGTNLSPTPRFPAPSFFCSVYIPSNTTKVERLSDETLPQELSPRRKFSYQSKQAQPPPQKGDHLFVTFTKEADGKKSPNGIVRSFSVPVRTDIAVYTLAICTLAVAFLFLTLTPLVPRPSSPMPLCVPITLNTTGGLAYRARRAERCVQLQPCGPSFARGFCGGWRRGRASSKSHALENSA